MQISKSIKFGIEVIKSNFFHLSLPYKLNFAITYKCNSRCLTCNIWKIHPHDELTLNEIKEFAKKNDWFKWIGLTGGEPFLREDISQIAEVFSKYSKGLYILTIPTNALCNGDFIEEKIKEILELKIPRVVITISLDGYEKLHDRIRGVKGNYQKAINLYKRLKRLKQSYPNF
ncbi:MAG: radical SAM protein, partial [Candidatus Micrarchaeia archaeon]